jgi:hypothetical protein
MLPPKEASRDQKGPIPRLPLALAFVVALLRNPRKTECGAGQFLVRLEVRAAPFAVLRNSRKTECGAGQFLNRFAVRAAPFALPRGRGSKSASSACYLTFSQSGPEQLAASRVALTTPDTPQM